MYLFSWVMNLLSLFAIMLVLPPRAVPVRAVSFYVLTLRTTSQAQKGENPRFLIILTGGVVVDRECAKSAVGVLKHD